MVPKAKQDLKNIKFYIKHILNQENISSKMINNILKSILTLDTFPERHIKLNIKNLSKFNIRKFRVNNFIILYQINTHTNEVYILHIFHIKENYFNKL